MNNADETILRLYAEKIAAGRFGDRATITSIQRTPIHYLGSYDCYVITIRLTDGEEFRFFLKDFGFSRHSKDNGKQRRERELAVYRDLLARIDLGTPEYYGSVWDDSQERFWLFLELVEGVVIKDHNVDHGVLAASWLGKLQGFFDRHADYLSACNFLIRHDARFFRSKAEAAINNVARIAPGSARPLSRIVDRYEQAIHIMADQPLTLVHGGYIPWHIILDYTCNPVRVCPIDWELAALGAPLYDLAFFTDGVEPQVRDRIWDAYLHSASQYNALLPGKTQMRYLLDCYRLHRIFDWLSRSLEKQFSEDKVMGLVAQAEKQSALFLM